MYERRRFWNRWDPPRTNAIARVPSHFSSKGWSGESNGVSRLSASIGLITCAYGSKDAIRSAGLRRLETRLEGGHQILRGLHLDPRDRGELLPLDLRLNQLHEGVPVPVLKGPQHEFHRERLDQLEGEVDLRVQDDDGVRRRKLRWTLHLVLVHQGREDEPAVEGADCDELLLLPQDRAGDRDFSGPQERLPEELERLQ